MEAALDALRTRFPKLVAIGFEELWDSRPDSEPQIDLGPPDASLERVLERIQDLNPTYKVALQGHGLVHVYPASGTADPVHLLDIRLKIFHLPPDRCIQYAIENLDWYRGGMVGGYAPELSEFLLKSEREWYRKHGKQPPGGGVIGGGIGGCLSPRAAGDAGSYASTVRRNITVREAMNLMAIRSLELSRGEVQTNDPAKGLQISSVNASLRILRRVLRIAVEWGELQTSPKIRLLAGENHRERVITANEEACYLAAANHVLADVATVLVDSGLRPGECYRLLWESITWANGRHGTFLVTHGKTKAARRVLPMTPRVRALLEARWKAAGKPLEGFVWSAPTKSGHMEPSTLKKQHAKALKDSKVRPFVFYSLRHTFLTRLGESGCDAWTLARIAGHSSIAISSRYVHPSEDAVLSAMSRLGGHKIGHSQESTAQNDNGKGLLSA